MVILIVATEDDLYLPSLKKRLFKYDEIDIEEEEEND